MENPYNPFAWFVGSPEIGNDVWIGPFTVIDGSGGLSIGAGSNISAGAQIYTHSTTKRATSEGSVDIERSSTRIGKNVHIGANAVVLMGVTIGDRSIIGACTLILEGATIPEDSVVVGNPGRILTKKSFENL
jgi:acetyltransferase-like isoleucine patch superfamily enzyme